MSNLSFVTDQYTCGEKMALMNDIHFKTVFKLEKKGLLTYFLNKDLTFWLYVHCASPPFARAHFSTERKLILETAGTLLACNKRACPTNFKAIWMLLFFDYLERS
jgi:hypothetical protein